MNDGKNIEWSPLVYEEAAVIAREAGQEMLSRLDWMTIKPDVVLDIGCGTGEISALLQKRYPNANVLPWDMDFDMVCHTHQPFSVCTDAAKLPLAEKSVDLIFANLVLPWCADFPLLLREWLRVLRDDGLLLFTSLGVDTLKEWRMYFNEADMPRYIDMHDIGDMLLQQGFSDPVLDVSYLTTVYHDIHKLAHELRATGMWFPDHPAEQIEFLQATPIEDKWSVTYEIIQAHAFAPVLNEASSTDKEVKIPLNHLRDSLTRRRK